MAAHCEGYSPRCSCTMRTARSRTSGENLFDLVVARSSQSGGPPPNTGRFRAVFWLSGLRDADRGAGRFFVVEAIVVVFDQALDCQALCFFFIYIFEVV